MPPDILNPFDRLIGYFSHDRHEDGPSPGDRAELRRIGLHGMLPPAFWRQIVAMDLRDEDEERAWAIVIPAMLEAGAPAAEPVGRMLAYGDVAYAEARFVRLLRARGHQDVAHQVRQATRWCAAQGRRLRFSDDRGPDGFGPFILAAAQGQEKEAERRAHAIARHYFSTLQRATRATEN